jgi:hypothetical protein
MGPFSLARLCLSRGRADLLAAIDAAASKLL